MYKAYDAYLKSLYKSENSIVDVLRITTTKDVFTTKIQKEIVKISAKHNYNAHAKINLHESKNICDAMKFFKNPINGFMDVVNDLKKKKMNNFGHHARALEDDHERESNAFEKFLRRFADKYCSYLGGKTHRRELIKAEFNAHFQGGADIKEFETIYEKVSHFFDGYPRDSNPHGRELAEGQAGVNAEVQADGKLNIMFDKFSEYIPFF